MGCVAVENVGDVALLRMLAVVPERRGEGLGYVLVEGATERARAQGVKQFYLVTDGAQGYFGEKLGFLMVDRKDVDPGIAQTADICSRALKSATWMRKDPVSGRAEGDLLAATLHVALDVANEAGKILIEGWGTRPAVGFKSEDINLRHESER